MKKYLKKLENQKKEKGKNIEIHDMLLKIVPEPAELLDEKSQLEQERLKKVEEKLKKNSKLTIFMTR